MKNHSCPEYEYTDNQHISLKKYNVLQLRKMFNDALKLSSRMFVEYLDPFSLQRTISHKSYSYIHKMAFQDKSGIILYTNLVYRENLFIGTNDTQGFQLSLRTNSIKDGLDYFIWIEMTEENGLKLIKKYDSKYF